MTISSTADEPLAGYVAGRAADELFDADGRPRSHWADLAAAYRRMGSHELRRRADEIRLLLEQDGVTYNLGPGPDAADRRRHRPWHLDPVPLVLAPDDWRRLERGVAQRAELLDLVLADLYGERRLLRRRLIPPVMIFSDPQFDRACDGIVTPGPRQLVLAAVDLARTTDGTWLAFSHRTQAPSGAGYALENRRVVSRVFPSLFSRTGVQRLAPYVRALRSALRAAAPPGVDDPSIVILSPGPLSETAFEHASIAAQLGYPLVHGDDLEVRHGRVWLRTVGRPAPVDVILRRVDSWFSDPLELRPTSTLGVAGLVDACRTRTVSVVNPLGSGVLENAGLHAVLDRLARPLLGTDLVLPSAPTWWCGDPVGRSHVLANLASLVVRPLSRGDHLHTIDTATASRRSLDDLRRRIEAHPDQWVGQQRLEPATTPTLGPDGIEPRATVLRSFAVATASDYQVMAGGLARSAGRDPLAPITNRTGATAKDVWVVGAEPEGEADFWLMPPEAAATVTGSAAPARAAQHLFWLGRYAERAEATARLLRTINDRRDEFLTAPGGPGQASLTVLLEALTRITGTFPGFVGDDRRHLLADPGPELTALVVDGSRAGTVAHAVENLYQAIDVLRDQLSIDTWLVVGSLQGELDRMAALTEPPADGPATPAAAGLVTRPGGDEPGDDTAGDDALTNVCNALLLGLLALGGLTSESMVRDDAWQFLESGRRIERALQVAALVGHTLTEERAAAAESLVLESVLTAGESIITYRRRYRSRARVATVVELLVCDPGNPRSLTFQVTSLAASLRALRAGPEPSAAERFVEGVARRVDGIDVDALVAPGPPGRRRELAAIVESVAADLRAASDAVAADYFTRLQPQHSVLAPAESPRERP